MAAEAQDLQVARPEVLIAGNPNAGKTTLFNQLAGTRARTGNYPGVTVDRRVAEITLGNEDLEERRAVRLVDVPGTYSLSARSPEEQIAVDSLLRGAPAAVVVVVDATALGRGLYLASQVIDVGVPTVIALNMMDEARRQGIQLDTAGLADALGTPIVEIVASRREGLDALSEAITRAISGDAPAPLPLALSPRVEEALETIAEVARATMSAEPRAARAWASWALLSLGDDELQGVPPRLREVTEARRATLEAAGEDVDAALIGARYAHIDALLAALASPARDVTTWSERIDRVLTHPVLGLVVFAFVMLLVFEALFTWAEPLIGFVEAGITGAQDLVRSLISAGAFQDLLAEGVVAGVGNVVVFVPQIGLLFLLIAFLEDSGYLARVAFVIDRLMKSVGLHGKAFVPLLSGFACAIPAVMATRTIEDRRDRLVTMLALPLMSCSARLPVYVLLTATVFVGNERVGGVLSVGALVLFAMYALSVLATLGAAAVMRRTVLKGPRPTLVLELPPYRWPMPRNLVYATWARVRSFLVDAGTVILALTIVLWAALSYPKNEEVTARAEAERVEAAGDAEALAAIDAAEAQAQLQSSFGGRLGKVIEPALEPLGMDWRLGIGVIGAFAAREVFVSTLGVVFGIGDEADEESEPLRQQLREARREDGTPLMTPLSGIALMVFFVLACQCMSTIAVVRRESGTWRWPIFMFTYMTVLAYVSALGVYQLGALLGWGTG